ncbi:hypothetical protein BGX27_005179, partial [Mortierella sp. AM989]
MAVWAQECSLKGETKEEAEMEAKSAANEVEVLNKKIIELRRSLAVLEKDQSQKSLAHRKLEQHKQTSNTVERKDAYKSLTETRTELRNVRNRLMPMETKLRELRRTIYYWNKVAKVIAWQKKQESNTSINTNTTPDEKSTVSDWSHFTVEDNTEKLDISKLMMNARGKNRQVVFAGTDYGICKMSETIAQTQEEIETHINRYNALFACSNTSDGDVVDDPSISNSSSYNEDKDSDISLSVLSISSQPSPVSKLKLPKSFKITAPQVNEISHTRKRMRRRENRLKNKGNIGVKAALVGISEQEHVLKTAQNMEEIDSVHRYHLSERDKLRAFEFS